MSDTPMMEIAEGKGLNPYFEGQFDGESNELRALRLTLVRERDEWEFAARNEAKLAQVVVRDLERELSVVKRRRDEAQTDLGIERMRLMACGVIALANTPESAAKARGILPQYRSASSADVTRAVDREMQLRAEVERLRKTLDEIATYWNGSHRPAETLDAAEWMRGVAEEALAATEAKP